MKKSLRNAPNSITTGPRKKLAGEAPKKKLVVQIASAAPPPAGGGVEGGPAPLAVASTKLQEIFLSARFGHHH